MTRILALLNAANKDVGLSDEQLDYLQALYGTLTLDLLTLARTNPALGERIHENYPDIMAQIHRAVSAEYCLSLNDFIFRRSMLGFTHDQGMAAAERIATELGQLLNWSEEELQRQYDVYREHIDKSQAFRAELGEAPVPEFTPHLQQVLTSDNSANKLAPTTTQQRKKRGEEHRY